jgi:membrane-bound ClpP family serine protease
MIPSLALFAGFFVLCVWLVVRAQRRPQASGPGALAGEHGRVVEPIGGGSEWGKVVFHGEIWDAAAEVPIPADAMVVVTEVAGRLAQVRPLNAAD